MSDLPATADPAVRRGFMKRLFDRVMVLSAGRHALWLLAAVSFTEASFFPIPADPVLAAIVLARRDRAWIAAAVCTIASVLGGLFGYAIGAGLYETIGQWIISAYHLEQAFENFRNGFDQWGAWIIIAKGFTPIPFKLVTIASGIAEMNLATFVAACILTRGARFLLVAALFYAFGPQARAIIERNFRTVMALGTFVVILGFVAVIYI